MVKRMESLYEFADFSQMRDLALLELSEHCAILENQIADYLETIPEEERYLLESYLEVRDELEFYHVKTALQAGKRLCGEK